MKKTIFVSIFAILFIVSGCFAQSDWASVRDLKSGTRVVIVERTGAETKARVSRADDTTVFLDKGRTIARDSIARVYLTKRGSILKSALIGAAAGAGIGTAIGVGVTVATKGDGLAAAGGFLVGIPVGAAVGAATVGRKRGRLIYESP
jgi:hypothetical protein